MALRVRLILFGFLALLVLSFFAVSKSGDLTSQQELGPYSHIIRLTGVIEFDGEKLAFDDLIDCVTPYAGPASRAVQLPFDVNRYSLAQNVEQGSVVIVSVSPVLCTLFPGIWAPEAGVLGREVPEHYVPVIRWFNAETARKSTRGETYNTVTAINNPDGRATA